MGSFSYITEQKKLKLALDQLAKSPCLAIDTESSGYYTYFSDLCLIQISAEGHHYVIDTLVDLDLTGLAEMCQDSRKTKIFHSASSDIIELKRAYNWEFVNIFDTFLASRILGHANCSLASLVAEYRGVTLEKKEQKSNWKHRPLTNSQLEYAHLDTFYLESIMDSLMIKLKEYGMYEEIAEEFEHLCHVSFEVNRQIKPEGWKLLPDAKQLNTEQQAILRELYLLRENRSRQENIAPFRMLSNHTMVRLARERPDNLSKPLFSKIVHPIFLRKDKGRILEILQGRDLNLSLVAKEKQVKIKVKPEHKILTKKLKNWRKKIAEYRGIDPSMVLSAKMIDLIVKKSPSSIMEMEDLNQMTAWKIKNYGQQVLDIVSGRYEGSIPKELKRLPNNSK